MSLDFPAPSPQNSFSISSFLGPYFLWPFSFYLLAYFITFSSNTHLSTPTQSGTSYIQTILANSHKQWLYWLTGWLINNVSGSKNNFCFFFFQKKFILLVLFHNFFKKNISSSILPRKTCIGATLSCMSESLYSALLLVQYFLYLWNFRLK